MSLTLPEENEAFDVASDDGAIFKIRRHGNPDGLRLYISHGNGFAVDAYYAFWSLLLDKYDVILFDMRNHGRNPQVSFDGHNYFQMARDIGCITNAVEERLGAGSKVGVFHSMSARAAMKHAVQMDWIWDALVLFDPPNVPPKDHRLYPVMRTFEMRLVEFAAGRQEHFASRQELADYYAESRAHAKWVAGSHALMANALLHEDGDGGGWSLTCRPEFEAAIYLSALTMDLWPQASEFAGPTKLIAADPGIEKGPPTGPANQALAEEGGYTYEVIPGTGHMLQLERPQECVAAMLSFLADCGLAT